MKRYQFSKILNRLLVISTLIICTGNVYSNSDQRQISTTSTTDTIDLRILIDSKSLDKNFDLVSLHIFHELNKQSYAEVTVQFNNNLPLQHKVKAINSHIKLQMGYNSNPETIFSGKIVSQNISQAFDGPYIVTFKCENNKLLDTLLHETNSPSIILQYGSTILNFELEMDYNSNIDGFVSTSGTNLKLLNSYIELKGLSQSFNQIYKVYRVEHHVDSGEWISTLYIEHKK